MEKINPDFFLPTYKDARLSKRFLPVFYPHDLTRRVGARIRKNTYYILNENQIWQLFNSPRIPFQNKAFSLRH